MSVVEARVGDGAWRAVPLPGGGVFQSQAWGIDIDAPASGSFVVQARAYDVFGQVSAPGSTSVTVDNTPPTATLTSAAPVRAASAELGRDSGGTRSPPPGRLGASEVQVDDGEWRVAPAPYPLAST
ncbi:MAG: hypothetical protein U0641_03400 [Anaerolineae bacterium]